MKDFFSKNWKKIFYVVGGVLIVIDLFFIIATPPSIPENFLEYGPNVESDIFDGSSQVMDNIETTDKDSGDSFAESVSESTGFSPQLTKGVISFTVILAVLLVLSAVIDGSGGADKGKKKK